MKFVFIDDDKNVGACWKEWAKDEEHSAELVDNILDAVNIRADFYVFDISAVASIFDPIKAYSPICTLIEHHPGAVIVIVSGIGKGGREDIIDIVKEYKSEALIVDGGWGRFEDFEKAIEPYM